MVNGKPINGHSKPTEIPPFVQRRANVEDERSYEAWDGWVVETTGDPATDYKLGQDYAAIAARIANANDNPGVISFSLSSIYLKQAHGLIEAGEIERGFIDRISRLACLGALN